MDCPNCGLINPDSAQRCDCGYCFTTEQLAPSDVPGRQIAEPSLPDEDWTCPNCGLLNPQKGLRCDCGFDVSSGAVEESLVHRDGRAGGLTKRERYARQFWGGLGLLLFGILATFVSAGMGGGAIHVFVGAIAGGLLWSLIGLIGYLANLNPKE